MLWNFQPSSSSSTPPPSTISTAKPVSKKVTITQVFDFAGEEIRWDWISYWPQKITCKTASWQTGMCMHVCVCVCVCVCVRERECVCVGVLTDLMIIVWLTMQYCAGQHLTIILKLLCTVLSRKTNLYTYMHTQAPAHTQVHYTQFTNILNRQNRGFCCYCSHCYGRGRWQLWKEQSVFHDKKCCVGRVTKEVDVAVFHNRNDVWAGWSKRWTLVFSIADILCGQFDQRGGHQCFS